MSPVLSFAFLGLTKVAFAKQFAFRICSVVDRQRDRYPFAEVNREMVFRPLSKVEQCLIVSVFCP